MSTNEDSPPDMELERTEFALEVAGVAWWEFDCDRDAVRMDRRTTAKLGYDGAAVVPGSSLAALVHPDDLPSARRAMRGHLDGSLPEYRADCRLRAPSGEYRWYESIGRVRVRDERGAPCFVTGVFTDITERVRQEHAMRDNHGRLRHAEEVARFGHWEFSIDERVMYASEGAVRIYGFERAGAALADVQACVLAEHRPALDHALHELIARGTPYDEEFRVRRVNDGQIVWVHSRAEFDAVTRRVFGVVHDISDRKRAEEEREALIAELQRAAEEVKTLTGILPICSSCKKIRDDEGYWEQVEAYVVKHTDARFSHGICPDCLQRLYPDAG